MKKRVICPWKCRSAAVLAALLCTSLLNACAANKEQTETTPSQTLPAAENTASGYQFVTGYGIIAPNNPRVYQKDPALRPSVKEEDASVELLYAAYQDGVFRYRFRIADTSIEIIPEDEVKELPASERDINYFAIDEDKGIYGRSAYESRVSKSQSDGSVQRWPYITSVTGKRLPEKGTSLRNRTISRDYGEFLEKGYVITYEDYIIQGNQPEGWTPTETCLLNLTGFSEPMEFDFVPAPEYAALDEIPGITKAGDYCILAQAETRDNEIVVTTYTWPKEGHKLTGLADQKLEYQTEGGSGVCRDKQRRYSLPGGDTLQGISGGIQGDTTTYDLPDAAAGAAFTLTSPMLIISSEEASEITTIPIPPLSSQVLQLDQQIRLKDCTIKLTEAKRSSEDVYYGNIDGVDVMKPAMYIDFEVETIDDNLQIEHFQSLKMEPGDYPSLLAYTEYEDINTAMTERRIKDYLIFLEEGDQEVSFRIDFASYRLKQDVKVPVLMEE